MSDGYKNTLSMIGDIAYRMAVLNPMLGDKVLEDTSGVVVIDEIDLHLHPQWQQTIISDLNTIFPKIQFIVSSHAPAVMNLFYSYMDENNYKEANNVLTEIEAIVGTTDPDIAAARTSLDLEKILGE